MTAREADPPSSGGPEDPTPTALARWLGDRVARSRRPGILGPVLVAAAVVSATVAGIVAIAAPLLVVGVVAEWLRVHLSVLQARPLAAVVASLLVVAVPVALGVIAGWFWTRRVPRRHAQRSEHP